ncbi:MAG TPA: DUF2271 domain-containing protein [Bacteroidales bacterium]|nr:DUF2271 domain-containing protein [Bacteroidales bacterium]HRW86504.1 DUF2271 domain-containing protein [Bacteroidales bacterium]
MKILFYIILTGILILGTSSDYPDRQTDFADPVQDFEVNIELEISGFEGRSHRPFVAVWVENEESEPVRTISVWYNSNRWLPDLKRWYAKHFELARKPDFVDAITGATRSAGKYTLKWNLKDDNGTAVAPGKYTVYIEVVREKGTYQLISKEIELNENPKRINLEGGVEVASAAIEYARLNPGNK